MNARRLKAMTLATAGALALGLAGCGSDNKTTAVVVTPTQPPVTATKLEDTFGTGFGSAYRGTPNTEPTKPATTDLGAISLTTEPTALH